jgi:hypothetical protein
MYYLVKINNLWLVIGWMIILLLKLKKIESIDNKKNYNIQVYKVL